MNDGVLTQPIFIVDYNIIVDNIIIVSTITTVGNIIIIGTSLLGIYYYVVHVMGFW